MVIIVDLTGKILNRIFLLVFLVLIDTKQLVVVLCAVLGTIIYRLSLVSVIYGGGGFFLKKHAKIVTSVSAALINLIIIMCLTRVSRIVMSE